MSTYYPGQKIMVRAWWTTPPGQFVECEVTWAWKDGKYLDVKPTAGGHGRFISIDTVGPATPGREGTTP